jgi:hypothetical protein
MSLFYKVRSTRNAVDFALRRVLSLGFRVEEALPADLQFQKEMAVFFGRFDWAKHLRTFPHGGRLTVLDVGARNFSLAPVFHRLMRGLHFSPQIHGIEIDAYRRLSNLHTRRDYADYFVSQTADSKFHVCDFLKWEVPADCIFLLNPFVTPSPLLAWGLPLRHFNPERFFAKVTGLLKPGEGLLFVTNPSEEEVEITKELLERGFELLETHNWFASAGGHPRYGGLYRRRLRDLPKQIGG